MNHDLLKLKEDLYIKRQARNKLISICLTITLGAVLIVGASYLGGLI